ncbi:MAG: hypothetical protein KF897_07820 [Opitutaceae bacterium]|nr:hypothetical protein [Opitutaceae bacterium]
MSKTEPSNRATTSAADWVARIVFYTLMVLAMFTPPLAPANELDASWRMALSKCFIDGLQFGTDVVFTYGPLGFLMGKTYCGLHYDSLLVWQLIQALVFSCLIFRQGLRLQGYSRYAYFAFFFLLGLSYEDSLHQMVIALLGFELLRRHEEKHLLTPALLAGLIGLLGLFKFTNLMIGGIFVLCTAGLLLWRRQPKAAAWRFGWFAGVFVIGWVSCGQNPLNLPAYFYNSWEISQGYQETMGIPTPPVGLLLGLISLGLIIAYALVFLFTLADRARAVATTLALGAFVFLNWKHGFVRADGHMIGFFYAVILPATAFPLLLDDGPRFRRTQGALRFALVLFALAGVGHAIPGLIRGLLSNTQERVVANVTGLMDLSALRAKYQDSLRAEVAYYEMPQTRATIGGASVDVLGYEQAVAIYNQFNYRPRPVLQSYSAYRPHLSRLNLEYYASDRAPEFVLLKLHTIDQRLVACDDAEVLSLLVHRYEYVLSEKGFQLWRRKAGPFDPGAIAPQPLRTASLAIGQPFVAEEFSDRPLWAVIDVRPSLLGRLRGFLYKLPIVILRVKNTQGIKTEYRLPLPLGRTGFIINPVVEDIMSYMQFAGGKPDRLLHSLEIVIAPEDWVYFADHYTVKLSALPPSLAGRDFFREADKQLFRMFDVTPTTYEAKTSLSEGEIDGRPVMVFHAPSEMTLNVPKGATQCSGAFGFLPGAYSNGNSTDGATFYITWVLGTEEILLLERNLDPANHLNDRGLQYFKVTLPPRDGGYLRLRIHPGERSNFAWDWTAWTGLNVY